MHCFNICVNGFASEPKRYTPEKFEDIMKTQASLLVVIIITIFYSCDDFKNVEEMSRLDISLKTTEATIDYQNGEHNKAISILESLIKAPQLTNYKKERISIYYNLACNHALLGNKKWALTYLEKAVEYGFANFRHIESDRDFGNIQGDERYKKIVADLKRDQGLWENSFINTPYRTNIYADKFIRPYWTSNSEHGRNRMIFEYALLRGPVGKHVTITCKNASNKIFNLELLRLKSIPGKRNPIVYRSLENNIGYVNIKSFYDDKIVTLFDSVFSKIIETDALIIDLRENGGGNGRVGWTILGYFTDNPFHIFKWKTRLYRPVWRAWGRSEEIYKEKPALRMADEKKYYPKPVVLLTRL